MPLLSTLQQAIAARLRAGHHLHHLPVLTPGQDLPGQLDPATSLDTAGTTLTISPPRPLLAATDQPGPVFPSIQISVTLRQDPRRQPRPSLLDLAEAISRRLHRWHPATPGLNSPLLLREEEPWFDDTPDTPHKPHRITLLFTTSGTAQP